MSSMRPFGAILVVLSVPAFLLGILYLYSTTSPVPAFTGDTPSSGYASIAAGAMLLVAGILLLVASPRAKPAPVVVPVARPQEVEIKRTEMRWGDNRARSPGDALQDELDAVNKKIGQLKVQYGMGEVSAHSYKALMADLEKERSVVERRIIEARETSG